jgi:cyclopropane-fatty-acyl-phospholipid synthase
MVEHVLGVPMSLRLRAWDGSEAGPDGAPIVLLRSPLALARLLWSPGELGLARAYVAGDLDVVGDLDAALREAWAINRRIDGHEPLRARSFAAIGPMLRAVFTTWRVGALERPPAVPPVESQVHGRWALTRAGRPHSRPRDRAVIAHHYDASNAFYALLLDAQMAYSCAYWVPGIIDGDLEAAQRAKFDLICRKLGLAPGMNLLDIGCGWGGLAIHAARQYGVHVTGVTLSKEQLTYARRAVAEQGLADVIDLQLKDYRDLSEASFDAIATIEMGEHVGAANYPSFAASLRRLVRPGGRVLIQQMSRRGSQPGGGAFIERYIAPDMHMRPVGETVDVVESAGLEVRDVHALREHYALTIRVWRNRLETNWARAVGLLGIEGARMWRLYLVGSALAFEQGRMGVDQILAVRPGGRDAPSQPQR